MLKLRTTHIPFRRQVSHIDGRSRFSLSAVPSAAATVVAAPEQTPRTAPASHAASAAAEPNSASAVSTAASQRRGVHRCRHTRVPRDQAHQVPLQRRLRHGAVSHGLRRKRGRRRRASVRLGRVARRRGGRHGHDRGQHLRKRVPCWWLRQTWNLGVHAVRVPAFHRRRPPDHQCCGKQSLVDDAYGRHDVHKRLSGPAAASGTPAKRTAPKATSQLTPAPGAAMQPDSVSTHRLPGGVGVDNRRGVCALGLLLG